MRRDTTASTVERIWDLRNKLSGAILRLSACTPAGGGLVDPKSHLAGGDRSSVAAAAAAAAVAVAAAEARSLHAIRAALEDLEGHLHFLRDVIAQQQAERSAAIARLQQSRILLAKRLVEHRWEHQQVIEDTLTFMVEVLDNVQFSSLLDVSRACNQSGDNKVVPNGHGPNIMVRVLCYSLELVRNSTRLERIGGLLGNASVFALGMLAFVQLQQVAFHKQSSVHEHREIDRFHSEPSWKNSTGNNLEVSFARG